MSVVTHVAFAGHPKKNANEFVKHTHWIRNDANTTNRCYRISWVAHKWLEMSFSISVSANPFLTRLHFIFGAPISPCNCQLCRYIYINTGLGRFVFVSCFIVYKTMSENWHNTAPHTEITFDGKQYSIYARLCWAKNNLFFFYIYCLTDRNPEI